MLKAIRRSIHIMPMKDNVKTVDVPILIVAYNFLPYFPSFGGVARAFYLYKLLKKKGLNVFVLSATGHKFGYFGHQDHICPDDIFYVRSRINENKLQIKNHHFNKFSIFSRIYTRLTKLAQLFLVPDYSILDLLNFWIKLRRIIKDKNIKIVHISVPKHGTSLLTILIKLFFINKVKIILDYRDSWNTQPIFKQSNALGNKVSRALEKSVLKRIDYFTYVSPVVIDLIKHDLGIDLSNKSMLIFNGFDSSIGVNYRESNKIINNSLKLVYIGSANDRPNSYRNVGLLLELTQLNKNIFIDFYGELELSHHDLHEYPNVKHKGLIPTEKLKSISSDYNWCIVLHSEEISSREVIPGKFYDCINLKLPVLCLAHSNAEVSLMVEKFDIGIVCNPTIKDLCKVQHMLFDNNLLSHFNDNLSSNDLSFFERETQLSKFISIYEQLTNRPH